jgi:hypothetical protein
MIRIAVMYANEKNKRFDIDYYRMQHLRLVVEKYGPHGLRPHSKL